MDCASPRWRPATAPASGAPSGRAAAAAQSQTPQAPQQAATAAGRIPSGPGSMAAPPSPCRSWPVRVTIPCAGELAAAGSALGTGRAWRDMGMLPIPCPTHPCGAALFALRGSPACLSRRGAARGSDGFRRMRPTASRIAGAERTNKSSCSTGSTPCGARGRRRPSASFLGEEDFTRPPAQLQDARHADAHAPHHGPYEGKRSSAERHPCKDPQNAHCHHERWPGPGPI